MPTVLITDAGRGSALALIRSLGRKGWQVVAASDQEQSMGFLSRYTAQRLVYPSPRESAGEFVQTMRQAVDRFGLDLLIPVTDDAILPLAAVRQEFEAAGCQLAIADNAALHLVADKCATLELARSLQVPTLPTYLVRSADEATALAPQLSWPVVLKAPRSRRYGPALGAGEVAQAVQPTHAVAYAEDATALAAHAERLTASGPVLMQPYYAGRGEGVEMLAYEGRPLALFQHRRLAEVPVTGGASALRQSVPLDPTLRDYSCRLVQALNWTGLIMVEFKVGAEGPVLMEINGRVWGSLPLAVHSGMDFPARLGDLYWHGPPAADTPPATDYRLGVQACNLDLMALWLAQVLRGRRRYPFLPQPRRRQAVRSLLGIADPRRKYDAQSWHDPRPGLLQLWQTARKLAGKVGTKDEE